MLIRYKTFGILLLSLFVCKGVSAQNTEIPLTLQEAISLTYASSKSIEVANQEVQWAKNERQRLNSFWYPKITAAGAYTHLSNKVEVRESLSQFTNPAIDKIHEILPHEELISSLLNRIGEKSFVVPLFPENVTGIDAVATLPIFVGGKRLYANKVGKLMVSMADVNKTRVTTDQVVLLTETYYALRLGQKMVEVKTETCHALEEHFQNALKMEKSGVINKAERLFFQVNRDEGRRELQIAIKELAMVQNTLKTLIHMDSTQNIAPQSALFINETLPTVHYFKQLLADNNSLIQGIKLRHQIEDNEVKIAKSAYLPNIEAFGKQNLYSNGISKYLAPRTMVGVGFTWDIFDGLDREKKIKQAKITRHIIDIEQDKVMDDLTLAVDKFYDQTQIALDNVTALKSTIEMSKELVKSRRKAYIEGMATSIEVMDAELMLSKVRVATLMAYFQFDTGLINLLAICGIPDTFYQYSIGGQADTSF